MGFALVMAGEGSVHDDREGVKEIMVVGMGFVFHVGGPGRGERRTLELSWLAVSFPFLQSKPSHGMVSTPARASLLPSVNPLGEHPTDIPKGMPH